MNYRPYVPISLSNCAFAGDFAAAILEPSDDHGATDILDLTIGANDKLDGVAAIARRRE